MHAALGTDEPFSRAITPDFRAISCLEPVATQIFKISTLVSRMLGTTGVAHDSN